MLTEKFTEADLSALRKELLERITGPFEIAEILRAFLMDRGYRLTEPLLQPAE